MKHFTTFIVAVLTVNLVLTVSWQSVIALVSAMAMHTAITLTQKEKAPTREIETLKSEVEKAIGETRKLSLKLGFR